MVASKTKDEGKTDGKNPLFLVVLIVRGKKEISTENLDERNGNAFSTREAIAF